MTPLLLAAALVLAQDQGPRFTDIEIEKPFDIYLKANPLLMDVTGAKVIRLPKGYRVVLGVAAVAIRDGSAADRKRCATVCHVHAVASIRAEDKGIQVAHVERLEKQVTVTLDEGGKETASSVSKYMQVTQSQVAGWARDFPVVGRWKSADGKIYYLAIGGILDARGERVDPEELADGCR